MGVIYPELEWNDLVHMIVGLYIGNSIESIIRRLGLAASVYLVWQERNCRIFKRGKKNPNELAELFYETIRLRLMSLKVKKSIVVLKAQERWNVNLNIAYTHKEHVTVYLFYSPKASRFYQRFPFLESLTLKGLPLGWFSENSSIGINPWIKEIAVSFQCLKELHIHHMDVQDSDLELLAKTRGKDLRVLKISKCVGFSTNGLLHIGKYCNNLRTLHLKGNWFYKKDGKWFHELALQNTGIKSLKFRNGTIVAVKDLTLLAKNCSQSLVSLKIAGFDQVNLVDVFPYAVRLEDCFDIKWAEDQVDTSFKFPTNNGIRAMLIGCSKLERLRIHLRPQHGGLTDVIVLIPDLGLTFCRPGFDHFDPSTPSRSGFTHFAPG
nr:hypothetical protein [Tanacetum cinerariifolium]